MTESQKTVPIQVRMRPRDRENVAKILAAHPNLSTAADAVRLALENEARRLKR